MEIKVSAPAKAELEKVIASRKNKPSTLRIFISGYGWGGPSFGLTLDEEKEEDVIVEADDFTFAIEQMVAENYESFVIEYSDNWLRRGFTILPDGMKASSCS